MKELLCCSLPGILLACANVCIHADENAVDFERDILPIFVSRCYECHDGRKQTASFRVDVRASTMRGGESGEKAIVRGKSGQSELVHRITSQDEDLRMPPKGKSLSDKQVALIRKWIDNGAPWPDSLAGDINSGSHWAFQPPQLPTPPKVKGEAWVRGDIDRFVLARLEKEGLTPSREADRVTLLRRLSLDLIGLPPSIEEVDRFLADQSGAAYKNAVERLLKSPHYGERWGRHWLDAARYADSDGFEKDKQRQVWFYRDWVINALNRDLPYDQFVIEQIAGDLLPNPTQDQIVATGFLRNSMINEEGGIDPEQFRMEAMFDRMDAIGKSILGLTIQCGQCHNHKYDPLTQEEYYRMFAFINNSHEANVAVYTPDQQMRRAALFRKINEIEADLKHRKPTWRAEMAKWEVQAKDNQPKWIHLMPPPEEMFTGGQKYLPQPDGSLLAQGYAPTRHTATFHIKTDLKNITAFRLELLNDPNLPLLGPGRSIKGTGALTEFIVEVAQADTPEKKSKVKFVKATADVNPPERKLDKIYDDRTDKKRVTGPIAYAIDGDELTAWSHDIDPGRRNKPRNAVFNTEKPIANPAGAVLTIQLSQRHGGWNSDDNQNHNLGRFRMSITNATDAVADQVPKHVREILSIPTKKRSPAQIDAVFSYWRTTVDHWKDANAQIEELWQEHPAPSSQLVLYERDNPRMTSILQRGDFLKPIKEANPETPSFLHPLPKDAPRNRLTFARWLVDRQSPTAARAIVNRVWQSYFGTGLVSTSEDFGTRCEDPIHPELLDWLAVEFMENGWSLKSLHRLIVNSATYRQSSRAMPELHQRDPYNRLLTRGPRLRVEAEIVRDIALTVSGLLNPKIGGPSVYPPLPEFMFKPPASYGPKPWFEDKGPNRYRRGIYLFRYRSIPNPVLQSFDAPNGDFSCVRRTRSNTPLQALATLNEPIFMECARALALKIVEREGTDEELLVYAFRRCLSRKPSQRESNVLMAMFEKQKRHIADGWINAWDLAADDPQKPPELPKGTTPTQLAAWTTVSRVLLNLDETITKE